MRKSAALLAAIAATLFAQPAQARDGYLGEIFMVGYTFCPRNSLEADGRLLAISSNTALFSLLGTTYGGDGRTTFALPDLRGRVPVGRGRGSGLDEVRQGQRRQSEAGSGGHGGHAEAQQGTAELGIRFCVVTRGMFPSRS